METSSIVCVHLQSFLFVYFFSAAGFEYAYIILRGKKRFLKKKKIYHSLTNADNLVIANLLKS